MINMSDCGEDDKMGVMYLVGWEWGGRKSGKQSSIFWTSVQCNSGRASATSQS